MPADTGPERNPGRAEGWVGWLKQPGLHGLLVAALLGLGILLGHRGLRALQVAVLALPLVLWLLFPLRSPAWRALRWVLVSAGVGLFLVDGLLRAYLWSRYQALPDSSLVLSAVANTTGREAAEYLKAKGPIAGMAALALLAAWGLAGVSVGLGNGRLSAPGRGWRWVILGLLLFSAAALLSKPWRRHHPLLYWPTWVAQVADLRSSWQDQSGQRSQWQANAQAAAPTVARPGPATVVLVLSDSVNRDNMGLYGYGRPTTPQLEALSRESPGHWLTLRHAWSVQPGTLTSLSGLFSFGGWAQDDPVGETQHVLALARQAGYRVWWLSNHDDIAIDQQHAQVADTVEMINRQPGRSTSNLDAALMPALEAALSSPQKRKLIVVHLLGAHPHYRLRAPAHLRPFDAGGDAVDQQMVFEGRPAWLREMRQTYDAALVYHDGVVAETARLTQRHAPPGGQAAWLYLSDHGQEVGHQKNHAGHSVDTAAGYRIPALIWRSAEPFAPEVALRPFRADWASWTLADLMGLRWQAMEPARNVLHPHYRWEAPVLPIGPVRFDR